MPQEPVFVVVAGGVVKDAPSFVEVIDVDDLLAEPGEIGQTKEEWDALSPAAQEYVKTCMGYEYEKIQARIAEDEEQSKPPERTDPTDALLAIQKLLNGVKWTPDTLDQIAEVMRGAGYAIEDPETSEQ